MFTSSMKIAIFYLARAPNRVLPFLINFDSIASCTSLALVCAEKFKKIVETLFFYFKSINRLATSTDFPTPESPVKILGFSISIICYIMLEYFIVSIVGTRRSWKDFSLSKTNSGILELQFTNPCWVSGLTIWSKMHYARGKVISEKQSYIIEPI